MPEFILNDDKPLASDDFVTGYIEAMFFTNGDTGSEDEWLLNDLGTGRLTRKALKNIEHDCRAFLGHIMPDGCFVRQWLDRVSDVYDDAQAGRDFWFTRQGHGAGFWDRKELDRDGMGDALSEAANAQGEAYVYVNRGWIGHE